jgi:ABC-type transport system involved in Fe-S cluster assembly fused permease/ATPase subunit
VVNLIARFYDTSGGAVSIDGVDVRKLDAGHYRRQLAWCSRTVPVPRYGAGEHPVRAPRGVVR